MATFMDRTSPKRGLSTSLNANPSPGYTTNGNSTSCTTNGNSKTTNIQQLHRDLDKFTRYFLIKTVQVIVQSRLGGGEKGVRTECKPTGNDWFNLNITDIKEVSEQAKAALDKLCQGGFTIQTSWRVCCEISVRTHEGHTVVLELWIITNRSKHNEATSSQASSTVYSIYNKMSLTLKTLITATRISPSLQLTNRGQSANSYVVCYRIYACSPETNIDSEQKNCSVDHLARRKSPLPFDVDIRDFVGEADSEQFSPFTKLGSIRSDLNDLDISFCYRTDMRDSHNSRTDNRTTQGSSPKNQFNEECITAAKQLLRANNCTSIKDNTFDPDLKDLDKSSSKSDERFGSSLKDIDRPLCAAFASKIARGESLTTDLTVLEPAFTTLLPPKSMSNGIDKSIGRNRSKELTNGMRSGENAATLDQKVNVQSKPIQIPPGHAFSHLRDSPTRSNDSAPKSLTDSYVFVDLNPPFATDDQSDLNSFFHGPSPTFSTGFDVLKDVNEITNQLAVLEANVEQIDDFVDTICASENEDDDDICDHLAAVTGGCSFAAQSNQSSRQKNNLISEDQNMMRDRCRTVSDEQINLNHIQSI